MFTHQVATLSTLLKLFYLIANLIHLAVIKHAQHHSGNGYESFPDSRFRLSLLKETHCGLVNLVSGVLRQLRCSSLQHRTDLLTAPTLELHRLAARCNPHQPVHVDPQRT